MEELDKSLLAVLDKSRQSSQPQPQPQPQQSAPEKENVPPKPSAQEKQDPKPSPEPQKPADPPQKPVPVPAPQQSKEAKPASLPAQPSPKPKTAEAGVQAAPPQKPEPVPKDNQEGLREAQELLKKLHQEELQQLEDRNKELTRKNQDLKTSNGKLGIGCFLNALELLRLEELKRLPAAPQADQKKPEPLQELPKGRPEGRLG